MFRARKNNPAIYRRGAQTTTLQEIAGKIDFYVFNVNNLFGIIIIAQYYTISLRSCTAYSFIIPNTASMSENYNRLQ